MMLRQPQEPKFSRQVETVIPANHIPGPPQGEWTYSHYAALPDDGKRYEIVDGVLYMAPAPNREHQRASNRIAFYLTMYVELQGLGEIYPAPFEVELAPKTVVQPDIFVVLIENLQVLTRLRAIGAPDLAVEILSPGTKKYDRNNKFDAYARAGIREYWIVDPKKETVEIWTLEEDHYQLSGVFKGENLIQSRVIPTFSVMAKQLFPTD